MKRLALIALLLSAGPASADQFLTPFGSAPGAMQECWNSFGRTVPCEWSDLRPGIAKPFTAPSADQRSDIVAASPNSGGFGQYPSGSTPVTGIGTGSTGAVVGTLAAIPGQKTWICGFDVSGIGGTAALGPVVVAGLTGGSFTYQISSTAAGITLSRTFTPCIPASAVNTAITVTTTADGTATAVDVNAWGFRQ